MADVKIIWDGAALENLLHGQDGAIGRYMMGRARVVQLAARAQVNVRTGHLRDRINVRFVETPDGLSTIIVAQTDYAYFVHEGTNPHNIPGAFGIPAPFGVGGRFSGTKGNVSRSEDFSPSNFFHPGYRGNHYLSDNLRLFFM